MYVLSIHFSTIDRRYNFAKDSSTRYSYQLCTSNAQEMHKKTFVLLRLTYAYLSIWFIILNYYFFSPFLLLFISAVEFDDYEWNLLAGRKWSTCHSQCAILIERKVAIAFGSSAILHLHVLVSIWFILFYSIYYIFCKLTIFYAPNFAFLSM